MRISDWSSDVCSSDLASLHNHLADRLAADAALQAAVKAVRFEDLCRRPQETLAQLFAHCDLPDSDVLIAAAAGRMPMPSYYRPDFSAADLATVREITGPAAPRFGYDGNGRSGRGARRNV